MAAIDQIVQINISNAAQPVAQASFAIPLIMGSTNPGWTDRLRTYASPAAMLTDGYLVSSPEYIYAAAMYAQPLTPPVFKVGRRTSAANQVDNISVATLTVGRTYTITINGTTFTYTAQAGDTQQAILTALKTAISAAAWYNAASAVTGTGTSAVLSLTINGPGVYTGVDAQLLVANQTPGGGLYGDLVQAAAADNTWYGVCCAGASDSDILNAAQFVEANKKLLVQASATAAIGLASSTTDIASLLKAGGFKRSAVVFSPSAANAGVDAAWLASQLALTPGSNTWAFKALSGISADVLTDAQRAACIGVPVAQVVGKNANIYTQVGGVNVTQMGTTGSGQFIDVTVGLDWLQSAIQTNVWAAMSNVAKVPYTDVGTAAMIAQVTAAIQQGGRNGLIDLTSPITVTAPKVATVPQNQRAGRVAPAITFGCRLQGALHGVTVNGNVSV